MGIIYQALNSVNGKSYIGQTWRDLNARILEHTFWAMKEERGCPLFYSAIRKYGPKVFEWKILSRAGTQGRLDSLEKGWIEKLGSQQPGGYNLAVGGLGWKGCKHSKEANQQKSERMKAAYASGELRPAMLGRKRPEHAEKMREFWKGRCFGLITEESRKKMSLAHLGDKNHMKSEYHRERQRQLLLNFSPMSTPESRKKISDFAKTRCGEANSFYGKKHSEESRKKMRLSRLKLIEDGLDFIRGPNGTFIKKIPDGVKPNV